MLCLFSVPGSSHNIGKQILDLKSESSTNEEAHDNANETRRVTRHSVKRTSQSEHQEVSPKRFDIKYNCCSNMYVNQGQFLLYNSIRNT